MSFRARLRLFFVLIVIVPMLSVAIVLFRLISDNETGKADASIAARQRAAMNLYREATRRGGGGGGGGGQGRGGRGRRQGPGHGQRAADRQHRSREAAGAAAAAVPGDRAHLAEPRCEGA